MNFFLLILITGVVVGNLVLTAWLLCCVRELRAKLCAADESEMEDQERDARDLFNEGIDNIMRFSVNGKTGFETDRI